MLENGNSLICPQCFIAKWKKMRMSRIDLLEHLKVFHGVDNLETQLELAEKLTPEVNKDKRINLG